MYGKFLNFQLSKNMILYKKKYMFGIFYAKIRILIIILRILRKHMLELCAKNIYNYISFSYFLYLQILINYQEYL